jgi:hypothetical protein
MTGQESRPRTTAKDSANLRITVASKCQSSNGGTRASKGWDGTGILEATMSFRGRPRNARHQSVESHDRDVVVVCPGKGHKVDKSNESDNNDKLHNVEQLV